MAWVLRSPENSIWGLSTAEETLKTFCLHSYICLQSYKTTLGFSKLFSNMLCSLMPREAGPCVWYLMGSLICWLPVQCGQWEHQEEIGGLEERTACMFLFCFWDSGCSYDSPQYCLYQEVHVLNTHSFDSTGAPCSSFISQVSSLEPSAESAFWGDTDQLPGQNSFLREINFTLSIIALLICSWLFSLWEKLSLYILAIWNMAETRQSSGHSAKKHLKTPGRQSQQGGKECRKSESKHKTHRDVLLRLWGMQSSEQPPADTNFSTTKLWPRSSLIEAARLGYFLHTILPTPFPSWVLVSNKHLAPKLHLSLG